MMYLNVRVGCILVNVKVCLSFISERRDKDERGDVTLPFELRRTVTGVECEYWI